MDETPPPPPVDGSYALKPAQPAAIVIFGASGDLTCRKLLPALYQDWRQGMLAPGTAVIGISRSEMTDDAFRDKVRTAIKEAHHEGPPPDEGVLNEFAKAASYLPGAFEDDTALPTNDPLGNFAVRGCIRKDCCQAQKTSDS